MPFGNIGIRRSHEQCKSAACHDDVTAQFVIVAVHNEVDHSNQGISGAMDARRRETLLLWFIQGVVVEAYAGLGIIGWITAMVMRHCLRKQWYIFYPCQPYFAVFVHFFLALFGVGLTIRTRHEVPTLNDWLIIYRSYTNEDLAEEIRFLREEMRNPYAAQGLGSQSAQRDLRALMNRHSAAIYVRRERAGDPVIQDSVVDFSGGLHLR